MEPITVTIEGAKAALGIGTTKLYELINNKQLVTVRIGRRRLVRVDSMREYLDKLGGA